MFWHEVLLRVLTSCAIIRRAPPPPQPRPKKEKHSASETDKLLLIKMFFLSHFQLGNELQVDYIEV